VGPNDAALSVLGIFVLQPSLTLQKIYMQFVNDFMILLFVSYDVH